MSKCGSCGTKLRRVHRSVLERLRYVAIYRCKECGTDICIPRPYQYYLGRHASCPRCGTLKVSRLKERRKSDRTSTGPLNMLFRFLGGKLVRCPDCRLQFYDPRRVAAHTPAPPEQQSDAA